MPFYDANTVDPLAVKERPDKVYNEDTHRCVSCAETRPHTIRRLTMHGQPRLCDSCFAQEKDS